MQQQPSGRDAYGVSGVRAPTMLSLRALAPSRGARQEPRHARRSVHLRKLSLLDAKLLRERTARQSAYRPGCAQTLNAWLSLELLPQQQTMWLYHGYPESLVNERLAAR